MARARSAESRVIAHFAERLRIRREHASEFFDELALVAKEQLQRFGEFKIPGLVTLVVSGKKRRVGRRESDKLGRVPAVQARVGKQLTRSVGRLNTMAKSISSSSDEAVQDERLWALLRSEEFSRLVGCAVKKQLQEVVAESIIPEVETIVSERLEQKAENLRQCLTRKIDETADTVRAQVVAKLGALSFVQDSASGYRSAIPLQNIGAVVSSVELQKYNPSEFKAVIFTAKGFPEAQRYLLERNYPFLYIGTSGAVLVANDVASELVGSYGGESTKIHNRARGFSWPPENGNGK